MGSKYTKRYSEEFKRDAVALVASSGRTATEAARELGVSPESLRGWVKKANGVGQATAESFFAVLKEEIGTRIRDDRASARADIFTFIETYYNRRRLRRHPEWGYLTPHETRQRHQGTKPDHALAA